MRLIDADALIEELNKLEVEMMHARMAHIATQVIVDEAPTIDAVPVVRCKDCKRRKNAKENGRVYWDGYEYYCGIARYGVTDDGFCFYGERKDNE